MRYVLILVLCATVLISGCSKKEKAAPPPAEAQAGTTVEVGRPMPAYTAQSLDGSAFDLAKERGNVVLLNLWATWCGPCRAEIPELQALHAKYAAQRFKVIGVSVDEGPAADVKAFVDEQKMTYPVVLDPQGKLASVLETTVLPTSVILDRKGTVVWKSAGMVTLRDAEMNKALQTALR
jgi:cytochrome c biogenesis protein CcmG, thiol:disulfide interchange protein DsbE